MEEQLAFLHFKDAIEHYKAKNYDYAVAIINKAEIFLQGHHGHTLHFHLDTLYILSSIERGNNNHIDVAYRFCHHLQSSRNDFIRNVQSYNNVSLFYLLSDCLGGGPFILEWNLQNGSH